MAIVFNCSKKTQFTKSMKHVRQEKSGDEARMLNSDGTTHERSHGQVEPLHNTASGANHSLGCNGANAFARLALSGAHAAKSVHNTMLNAKCQGTTKPTPS